MECKHERLKTISRKGEEHLFCMDCGKELDISLLTGQNQPGKADPDPTPGKSPAKKTRVKKAEKSTEK